MPDIVRTVLVQSFEVTLGKETSVGQDHKERLRTMPFALNVVVTIRAGQSFRADPHDPVIKDVDNIKTGEIAAGMPGFSGLDQLQQILAIMDGLPLQLG